MSPDNMIRLFFLALFMVCVLAWPALGELSYPDKQGEK